MPRSLNPRERDPLRILKVAGWAPGMFWTGAENPALHRDSIPGRSTPQFDHLYKSLTRMFSLHVKSVTANLKCIVYNWQSKHN